MGNFEITDNFYLDGKPFQIIFQNRSGILAGQT